MSEIHLNKFEKEKRVIELHNQGKTIREISKIHMSFRDIGRIIKTYEKQQAALKETKPKSDSPHRNKKLSKNSQTFKLFRDGEKLIDVVIDLELSYEQDDKLWSQFLKLERMHEAYEFYNDYEYDIPGCLSIRNFIKNNHVHTNRIADILKNAKDIVGLQLHISILKHEIEELKQTKMVIV
ncbi:MAG: hypothetical protein ACR2F1_14660 [Nitrososphaeraceae archaeon]